MIQLLPFTSDTPQTLTVQLGSTKYDFALRWNERAAVWCMDITDTASQTLLVAGIPLVLGSDILSPYDLQMGSMVVVDGTGLGEDAGPDDLGVRVNVYWYSDGLQS